MFVQQVLTIFGSIVYAIRSSISLLSIPARLVSKDILWSILSGSAVVAR